MTAINLDLDKRFKFNFKRKITIGGQTYDVVFNDQLAKTLQKLQLQIENLGSAIDDKAKTFSDMNVDQQQSYLINKQDELVRNIEQALDRILGKKGAGKHIYDYYDHQSYALFQVVKVLRETKEKLDGTEEMRKRQEHAERRQQYLKQSKGKNHARSHR